jgi:hypothetical protein
LTVITGHYCLARLRISLLPSTRIRRDRNPALGFMAHGPEIKFSRDRFSKLLHICGVSHGALLQLTRARGDCEGRAEGIGQLSAGQALNEMRKSPARDSYQARSSTAFGIGETCWTLFTGRSYKYSTKPPSALEAQRGTKANPGLNTAGEKQGITNGLEISVEFAGPASADHRRPLGLAAAPAGRASVRHRLAGHLDHLAGQVCRSGS